MKTADKKKIGPMGHSADVPDDAGEEEAFDFGAKKKKSSKKKVVIQEPEIASDDDVGQDQDNTGRDHDDADVDAEDDGEGEGDGDDGDVGNDIDDEVPEGDVTVFAGGEDGQPIKETWLDSDRDYFYPELLVRVFSILRENNPELAGQKRRYTIVPPQIAREGSKKSSFANLLEICKRMHRAPEHVIQFMYAELGTTGSVDGTGRLIIRGRFQQKQIESVLRKYIVEYVTCKTCKSPDTVLRKENRLYFMQCESCGSSRSVSAIKTGFQAQTKSRRSQKAKAG